MKEKIEFKFCKLAERAQMTTPYHIIPITGPIFHGSIFVETVNVRWEGVGLSVARLIVVCSYELSIVYLVLYVWWRRRGMVVVWQAVGESASGLVAEKRQLISIKPLILITSTHTYTHIAFC